MTDSLMSLRDKVQASVKSLYFPELWYVIENFFQLSKSRNVLEVGCGFGLTTEALARSGWRVTCVDPSVTVLAKLKQRLDAANQAAVLEQVDVDTLPFAPQTFEAVVAINTLEFHRKPVETIREIARVLVPGGRAVVATFNLLSPWGVPPVAAASRLTTDEPSPRCMTKWQFKKALEDPRLKVETIAERARYLPGTTRVSKIPLPLVGAYVALIHKV
jgi:ubiquinone/menaquinone biosynthesis C-methylase UbiE